MARSKRQRGDESGCDGSDDDERAHGPGAAQRKRELERNRRNLVSVRFSELEAALARLPGAPARVQRRIDKEVVLKDAAQALAHQQRALATAAARITAMSAEVDALRAEKLDLRRDKTYLHRDVDSARADVAVLLADNARLWEALRKSGALASILAAHPASIPVDVVLGSLPDHHHAQQLSPQQLLQAGAAQPGSPLPAGSESGSPSAASAPREPYCAPAALELATSPSPQAPEFAKGASSAAEMGVLMKQFGLDDGRALIMNHHLELDSDSERSADVAQCA